MSVQVTPAMLGQIRDALRPAGPLTRTRGASFAPALEVVADQEARYQAALRKWHQDAPLRERARAAYEAANARRAAELGAAAPGQRLPILAALWASEPVRPVTW